jgi:hypothetical protein
MQIKEIVQVFKSFIISVPCIILMEGAALFLSNVFIAIVENIKVCKNYI